MHPTSLLTLIVANKNLRQLLPLHLSPFIPSQHQTQYSDTQGHHHLSALHLVQQNNVHPTNQIQVFRSIWTGISAFAATQVSLTLSAEPTNNMPTIRRQSGGRGLASQEEANSDGGNDIMDHDAGFLCVCGTADPGKWVECSNGSCAA